MTPAQIISSDAILAGSILRVPSMRFPGEWQIGTSMMLDNALCGIRKSATFYDAPITAIFPPVNRPKFYGPLGAMNNRCG